jgi:hypothetical protein
LYEDGIVVVELDVVVLLVVVGIVVVELDVVVEEVVVLLVVVGCVVVDVLVVVVLIAFIALIAALIFSLATNPLSPLLIVCKDIIYYFLIYPI